MKVQYLFLLLVTYVAARAVEEIEIDDSESVSDDLPEVIDSEDSTESAEQDYSEEEVKSELGHWYGSSKIAFSAYLSKDKLLGKEQHIKYDKVLLNDGDGYEAATGVFRAKVAGVYMFTYTIAQRHKYEIRAQLVYNGKVINGAVAEGRHYSHDVQGTNTAIIHVCKDKPVWVQATGPGRLEGDNGNYRFTSFSGYLLYARN